jgi:hypothetical protein
MRNDVDQSRDALTCAIESADRRLSKHTATLVTRDTQPVIQIRVELIHAQRFEPVLKRYTLA